MESFQTWNVGHFTGQHHVYMEIWRLSGTLDESMPRYFLDFTDTGELFRDNEGMELVDLEAARMEALAALGEIAKDQLRDGDHRDFVIDIREGAGPVVLTVSLLLRVERKA